MLQFIQLEAIKELLFQVSLLVDAFEAKSPGFVGEVKEWFCQIEHVLTKNRMPVAANVAALRGLLIGAERGMIPEGIQVQGRVTTRKVTMVTAIDLLYKVETAVSQAIQADMAQLDEAERLARQIAVVAQSKGLFSSKLADYNHSQMLQLAWKLIEADPDLASVATHLKGLVGAYDVLILLDRALPNHRNEISTQQSLNKLEALVEG